MDSSEFLCFLAGRASVRHFTNRPVTDGEISYILDAAITAPSAGNLEAWDVVIVRDEEMKAALAEAAFDQRHVEEAPVVLVVCANYVRSMSRYGERGILYAVQDATIACTYMMLAAHASQLRSCWTGAFDEEEVRGITGLPPHVRPVALLPLGHGPLPAAMTPRMAVGEHVHYDQW